MADPGMVRQAIALQGEGKFQDATRLYQQMLRAEPANAGVLNLFAGLLAASGKGAEALGVIGEAIRLDPSNPELFRTLAAAHAAAGDRTQAGGIHMELGALLQGQENFSEAIADYDKGIGYDPGNPHLHSNRGAALRRMGRPAEAIEAFGRALELDPALSAALSNRANTHWELGDAEAAFRDHRAALALQPDDAQIRLNLAVALRETGRLEEALAEYDRAVELTPGFAAAHYDRGQLLAQLGRLREGFAEMEWRWDPSYNYKEPARNYVQPVWSDQKPAELKGRLFVTSEQGYGDTIQFSRYLPLLAQRGYDTVLEVQAPLLRLYQDGFARPGVTVVSREPAQATGLKRLFGGARPPPFAAHVGLLSLPERFATALDDVPMAVPYLTVPDAAVARWRARLQLPDGGPSASNRALAVGFVWQGDPRHRQDKTRSLPPSLLEPLLARPDLRAYSLQKGPGEDFRFEGKIMLLGPQLEDFQDTAAVIRNLDLVITVDTSVAHLAGALGCPVWIMLTRVGEWRWLDKTEKSPWYPTARLFRQKVQGEWSPVIDRIAAALSERSKARG